MKEKVLTTVVTFETTTQAIAMERECKKNISFLRPCVEMWGTERRRNSFLYEGTGSGI